MKTRFFLILLALFSLLTASSLRAQHDHGAHDDHGSLDDHGSHDDHGSEERHDDQDEHGAIELDATQRQAGGITLQLAGPGRIHETLAVLGEVKLDETRVVHVVPRVSGIATRVPRQVGDRVEEGDLLAVLESPELGEAKIAYVSALLADELARLELDRQATIATNTARTLAVLAKGRDLGEVRRKLRGLEVGEDKGKLLEAYSRLAFARQNLSREKQLVRQKISSDQAYQEALRDFEVAEAQYQATEESVRFSYGLERSRAEHKVQVADNALHNSRRRLLLLGVQEDEVAALSRVHRHEDGHAGHGHVEAPAVPVSPGTPPTDITEFDRHLAELSLRSPLAGVVLRRHLAPGERVTPDGDAFLVGDLSHVWVDLAVHPDDLDRVHAGLPVDIRARNGELASRGEVAFVQPILAEDVRTGFARVVLENPSGRWRPGLFVNGEVSLSKGESAEVVILRTAVIRRGDEKVAFVREGARFEPRELRLGRRDATHVEVLEGIDPGETYAATGAFVLKAELARESLGEAGHSH